MSTVNLQIKIHPYWIEAVTRGRMFNRTIVLNNALMNIPLAAVHFFNWLPHLFIDAPTIKAFKTRLKGISASQAFYDVHEFFTFDWETALRVLANRP